jgi:hypothetical protein
MPNFTIVKPGPVVGKSLTRSQAPREWHRKPLVSMGFHAALVWLELPKVAPAPQKSFGSPSSRTIHSPMVWLELTSTVDYWLQSWNSVSLLGTYIRSSTILPRAGGRSFENCRLRIAVQGEDPRSGGGEIRWRLAGDEGRSDPSFRERQRVSEWRSMRIGFAAGWSISLLPKLSYPKRLIAASLSHPLLQRLTLGNLTACHGAAFKFYYYFFSLPGPAEAQLVADGILHCSEHRGVRYAAGVVLRQGGISQ